MSLSIALETIIQHLRQGRFPNEQAISQGIVLRVLGELGWDIYNPTIVWPEYSTGEGRVDFALCHPPSQPIVFVEVKQPGMADNAVHQALGYAFHSSASFVVLTDGKTWSFYLPREEGTYDERRIYKLDLFERPLDEAARILTRYLLHADVESGTALETARSEYRNQNRRSRARQAIPEAWGELVENGDELLVALLADGVESRAGIRPEEEDLIDYLKSLTRPLDVVSPPAPRSPRRPATQPAVSSPTPGEGGPQRAGVLTLRGEEYRYRTANEAMVIVLRKLAEIDPTFLQRLAQHPNAQGTQRNYLAGTPEQLYPNRPDLSGHHEVLSEEWVVATNINNDLKKRILRLAAEVAGLKFGTDIIVEF